MPIYKRGEDKIAAQISVFGKTYYGPRRDDDEAGRKLAERDLIRLEVEHENDERPTGKPTVVTVDEFRDSWQELYPIGQGGKRREPSTWIVYMERTKAFAAKYAGRPMNDLSRRNEARPWVLAHPGTLGPLRTMYSDAMSDADDTGVTSNPFSNLRIARSEGRKNLKVISYEEMLDLLDKAELIAGRPFRAMCALAAESALREAETFAVSPWDANFAEQELQVNWQFRSKVPKPKAGKPDLRWAPPKNKDQRTIVLPPLSMAALKQVVVPEDGPRRPVDGAPVWLLTPEGKHYTTRSHFYWWCQVRAAIGRPTMQFHELKHFAASYMLNNLGIDGRHIITQTAHADTDLLYNLYGHPDEEIARRAIKEAFARARGNNVRHLRPVDGEDGDAQIAV